MRLTSARGLFSVTAFPVTICATVGGAIWLMARGVSAEAALGIVTYLGYLVIAICERILSLHESWLHSRGDLRTDIGLLLLNGVMIVVLTPVVLIASVWVTAGVSDALAAGL